MHYRSILHINYLDQTTYPDNKVNVTAPVMEITVMIFTPEVLRHIYRTLHTFTSRRIISAIATILMKSHLANKPIARAYGLLAAVSIIER